MRIHVHVYTSKLTPTCIHVYLYSRCTLYLIVFAVDECELEAVLCGVHSKGPGLHVAVQAVDGGAAHQSDVDRQVQCPNDAIVTDTAQRRAAEDKHMYIHMFLMSIRRKKQPRSYKQQGKASQHTQGYPKKNELP